MTAMNTTPEPQPDDDPQTLAVTPSFHVLGFEVGGTHFGLRVEDVREVVALGQSGPASGLELTAIPGVDLPFRGVVMLRRKTIPILDLRAFFELPSSSGSAFRPRVVVVEHGNFVVGIQCDGISGIDAWPYAAPDLTSDLPDPIRPYCELAIEHQGRLHVLLDVPTLLDSIAIR